MASQLYICKVSRQHKMKKSILLISPALALTNKSQYLMWAIALLLMHGGGGSGATTTSPAPPPPHFPPRRTGARWAPSVGSKAWLGAFMPSETQAIHCMCACCPDLLLASCIKVIRSSLYIQCCCR